MIKKQDTVYFVRPRLHVAYFHSECVWLYKWRSSAEFIQTFSSSLLEAFDQAFVVAHFVI